MIRKTEQGTRCILESPTAMPHASGFLWNKKMMIQVSCRGYAVAQHMQPEPSKYTYQPMVEGKIFMLPEQPFFAHSPGRFFIIKDEETGEVFSAPHEPIRAKTTRFEFAPGLHDIRWKVEHLGIELQLELSIPCNDVVELWQVSLRNLSGRKRKVSFYPYIPFGFMSWMNQSASYNPELGGIIGRCITPYQKLDDYFKNKNLKDLTYFLHDREPTSWESCRDVFEGEGGISHPDGVQAEKLGKGDALYETPAAILQYRLNLEDDQTEGFRFLLGPALNENEIADIRKRFFTDAKFAKYKAEYATYVASGKGVINIETADEHFDNFINVWLPRQVFYHGDVNRLSTDPQTRNYLQDSMGMSYIKPEVTRDAFRWALAQQEESGAMPDGILLRADAELKYINQIPHTDHCVWLPVCLQAYLNETNDFAFLEEKIPQWKNNEEVFTVKERIDRAMRWLLKDRDERGLNYIAQGDWNDPMNMVGYKGKGVSGWLSVATAHALKIWAEVCEISGDKKSAVEFSAGATSLIDAVNKFLWDGDWYGRGITDDGNIFGVSRDKEGRIFLNPNSWALMAGAPDEQKKEKILKAIDAQLMTPYGVMMLAPAYTAMRDDVGRVTQKHPGAAENGSIYNHAAVFYAWSLFLIGDADRGFEVLRKMIAGPDEEDYRQRGQMPNYIPNYYRGAYYQLPRTAGRSSQLFNTGTVSWVYRSVVEGLFGLTGRPEGLLVRPNFPKTWNKVKATRQFRGASFEFVFNRSAKGNALQITVNGEAIQGSIIKNIEAGQHYSVVVTLS